jgi:hypothetical protein
MRVLLDECLPAGLRRDLPGHDVTTVQPFGVIALRALSGDIDDLRPLMPAVLAALPSL